MDKENQHPITSRYPENVQSHLFHSSRPQTSIGPKPVYHPSISLAAQPYPLYTTQVITTDPLIHDQHHPGSNFGPQSHHQFPSVIFPADVVPGYYGPRENLQHPSHGVLKPISQNIPVSSQERVLVPPPMMYGSEGQHNNAMPFAIKTEASPTSTSQPRSNQSSLSPTESLWLPTTSGESDSRPCSRASTATGGGITKRSSKQVVEKLRRERINSSVNELKSLLLKDKTASNFATAKLEKADVLEMAVSRIRELEHRNRSDSLILDEASRSSTLNDAVEMKDCVTRYAAGFAQCTQEVLSFIEMCEGLNLDPSVKLKLFNHLQSCNRTLESATKKDTGIVGLGSDSTFSVSQSRQQFLPAQNDVKRSPFASVNMSNQMSPLLHQQQRSSSMFGSQLKTPPRIPVSPATPVSMKTNNPTTPQHFLRPHLFRQPQFTKPDLSPYNGSPIQSTTLSNFKDTCPVVLGTVATPPTPKQSMTTSFTRLGTVTSSRNTKFAICCTPSPPPPQKSLSRNERTPLARSSLARSSNFAESNDEEEEEEEAGFEPMFTATVATSAEDVVADDEVGGSTEGSCWRPW